MTGRKEAKGSDRETGHHSDVDESPQAQGEAKTINESMVGWITASLLLTNFPRDKGGHEGKPWIGLSMSRPCNL